MGDLARAAEGRLFAEHRLARPFSNFQFLASPGPFQAGGHALQRIFSEARRAAADRLIIETIDESAETADETMQLQQSGDFADSHLYRFTFWAIDKDGPGSLADRSAPRPDLLLGYAIVRSDHFGSETQTHVFESVFRKYPHFHNFIPCCRTFGIHCLGHNYPLPGVMYCQQNRRTKACAQVALRSLLATRLPDRPILYSQIQAATQRGDPANGLAVRDIQNVLKHFGVNFRDLDYTARGVDLEVLPYTRLLYAGIENGCGGLLGFSMTGTDEERKPRGKHIIPFFGHTFNQDAWAPRAQRAYFPVGASIRYIPSDAWVGNFIGHDDNFGSNFCMPRTFIHSKQVSYVAALLPDGMAADPIQAEAIAAELVYALFEQLPVSSSCSFWYQQLYEHVRERDIVLRTHAMPAEAYVQHLADARDWDHRRADLDPVLLRDILPPQLWVVEVSIPEIFATNYAKLGEIVIAGGLPFAADRPDPASGPSDSYIQRLVLARFPGIAFFHSRKEDGTIMLNDLPCGIQSHSPLFGCPPYS